MPAAIILGVLVSAFELPCTGGVYLAILSILAESSKKVQAYEYLFIYNLIFVLPLFIILLVAYTRLSPDVLESWRMEKRKWLRLAMGTIMILLGVGLIIGVF